MPASGAGGARYFERGDEFWEVRVEQRLVLMRRGRVGSPGETKVESHWRSAAAAAARDRAIAAKLDEGFVEGGGQPVKAAPPPPHELERSIIADPYDVHAYAVLADWLQDRGDPRGELIAMQLAGKQAAAQALLERHTTYFLGPLADHVRTHDGNLRNNARVTPRNGSPRISKPSCGRRGSFTARG